MKILVLDMINSPFNSSQLKYIEDVLGGVREERGRQREEWEPREEESCVELREAVVYKNGVNLEDVLWADKVIAGGSTHSVYDDMHWKEDLRRAYDLILSRRIPFHTICFGTQFLAWHLGEKVHLNPNGPEFGAVLVELTEAGRQHGLMRMVEDKLVHTSHSDCVERVPAGATLLAYNANSQVQAFQYENTLATQFHTDLPTEAMHQILELRRNAGRINIRNEEHYQEIKNSLQHGENAHEILRAFARD